MKYKVLTLTQPWATLVAIGAKKIETRSWATNYRGPLAIHAAAGLGPVGGLNGLKALFVSEPFYQQLAVHVDRARHLPRGAIVAVAELQHVNAIYRDYKGVPFTYTGLRPGGLPERLPIDDPERAFGDYTPGRYAWLLVDVRALPEPIPAKGALGLWNWEGDLS